MADPPTIVRFPTLVESAASTFTQTGITLFAGRAGAGQVFEIFSVRMFINTDLLNALFAANLDGLTWGLYTGSATKTTAVECELQDPRVIFRDGETIKIATSGTVIVKGYHVYDMQVRSGEGFLVAANRINLWVQGIAAPTPATVQCLLLGRYKRVGLREYTTLLVQQQGAA